MGPALENSEEADTFSFAGAGARVTVSKRKAGDLRPSSRGSAERRRRLVGGRPWSYTEQVHGAVVREGAVAGEPGDAILAEVGEASPAMFAADCALLGVVSPEGLVAAVHAGWRGLLAGVVEAAAAALRGRGASALFAVRGPVIGPECYEFGPAELARLVEAYGEGLAGRAASGQQALDLGAGVAAACARAGIELVAVVDACTGCGLREDGEPLYFSHRARLDQGRHALVVSALL